MTISKNTVKWITALHHKKYRQKYNKFLVEGGKMAAEILRQDTWQIHSIYALEQWVEMYAASLALHRDKITIVSLPELKKISALSTPSQVIVVMENREPPLIAEQLNGAKSLYLDGIQDPGNMGTILRIADWFGIDAVFCSEDCADLYNAKVIQSSMGAFLRVPSWRLRLSDLLELKPGWPVMGAVLDGETAFAGKWPSEGVLVIGSEGQGISSHNLTLLTRRLTIPKSGGAESLNAGVACGILCALWENLAG